MPTHGYAMLMNRLMATIPGSNSLVYILPCCNHKVLKVQKKKKSKLAKMMGIIFSIYFQLKVAQVLYYAFFTTYFNK